MSATCASPAYGAWNVYPVLQFTIMISPSMIEVLDGVTVYDWSDNKLHPVVYVALNPARFPTALVVNFKASWPVVDTIGGGLLPE